MSIPQYSDLVACPITKNNRKKSMSIVKFINDLIRRMALWELTRLKAKVSALGAEQTVFAFTREKRLQEFDEEAQVHREHYIARLDIDRIELGRKLAAGRHRVKVLERYIEETK